MRVVFYGNFNVDFTSEAHWAKSIESLGCEVTRLQEPIVPTDVVLAEALESDAFVWVHTHTFVSRGSISMGQVLERLRKAKIPTIAYHLDLYMGLMRWKEYEGDPYLNGMEHFFTVDKFMADWLNKNTLTHGYYLPAGVYDGECIMLPKQKVKYDIVFTGSKKYHKEYPYRPQLIDFLTKTYGLKFVHIGNDGEFSPKRGLALNQIYRNAKIVIGDTLQLNFDYPDYFSDRAFEVPGRGGFSIFPNIKGIENYYVDGQEIVLYEHGNLEDLKKKIDYYLTHYAEREQIRKAGYERTIREHTYKHRWQTIFKEVGLC